MKKIDRMFSQPIAEDCYIREWSIQEWPETVRPREEYTRGGGGRSEQEPMEQSPIFSVAFRYEPKDGKPSTWVFSTDDGTHKSWAPGDFIDLVTPPQGPHDTNEDDVALNVFLTKYFKLKLETFLSLLHGSMGLVAGVKLVEWKHIVREIDRVYGY